MITPVSYTHQDKWLHVTRHNPDLAQSSPSLFELYFNESQSLALWWLNNQLRNQMKKSLQSAAQQVTKVSRNLLSFSLASCGKLSAGAVVVVTSSLMIVCFTTQVWRNLKEKYLRNKLRFVFSCLKYTSNWWRVWPHNIMTKVSLTLRWTPVRSKIKKGLRFRLQTKSTRQNINL